MLEFAAALSSLSFFSSLASYPFTSRPLVYADPDCTSSVTFCSIDLSSSPFSWTFFSFPKSTHVSVPSRCAVGWRTHCSAQRGWARSRWPRGSGWACGGCASSLWGSCAGGSSCLYSQYLVLVSSSLPRAPAHCIAIFVSSCCMEAAYRVAALCSLVWQNRNLSSFSPALNAYLDAMVSRSGSGGGYQLVSSSVSVTSNESTLIREALAKTNRSAPQRHPNST